MGQESLNTVTAVELSSNNNDKLLEQKVTQNIEATELKKTKETEIENLQDKTTEQTTVDSFKSTELPTASTIPAITNGCRDQLEHSSNNSNDAACDSTENVLNQEFRVSSSNGACKLRLVPLANLLRKSVYDKIKKETDTEDSDIEEVFEKKTLPKRATRKNHSIVEISDSENDEDQQQIVVIKSAEKSAKPSSSATLNKTIQTATSSSSSKSTEKSTSDLVEVRQKHKHKLKKCLVRIQRLPSAVVSTKKMSEVPNGSTSVNSKKCISISSDDDSDCEEVHMLRNDDNDEDDKKSTDSLADSSDSEIIPARKQRVFNKRKKSNSDDSDFEISNKTTKTAPNTKRRRVKIKGDNSSSSDTSGNDDDDDEKAKNKRKQIRKIIKTSELDISTKEATKQEEERRKRIEERQKIYNQIYDKPESVEVTELVLDFDAESKEVLLQVDKGLLKKLKPHQVAGVKFMWDACFETLKDTIEKPGSGCILAHCMGLGKTLQVVALTHTLLVNARKTNVERALIISPLSTLANWAREFKHWMSFARKKNIEIYDISKYKDKAMRIFKLNEWFEEGGVCILGYDMYRILANEKAKGLRKQQREALQKSLVEPGPDMVICDEGHLLKNEKTSISKAVTKMRTKRRIVLTGTPLQNNLKEYYCMIQFVKPNLLGTYKEYLNRFVNPITNGQYTDSTERDIRLMKHRSHILHKMLEGSIQRRDYSVLAPYLPPKHEYVVYTTLTDLQQQLYEYYMNTQRDLTSSDISGKGARLFQDFQDLRRIWTHPMNLRVNSDTVIRKRVMEDFLNDDDEEEEIMSSTTDEESASSKSGDSAVVAGVSTTVKRRGTRQNQTDADAKETSDDDVRLVQEDDPSEWWKRMVDEKELQNINHSPKLVILMKLLQQCETIGDKVLVFSQSLQSLDVIEHFLRMIDNKTQGNDIEGNVGDFKGNWTVGADYFRLDGSCSVDTRESMCKKFNDSKNLRARLFLISTRAGGLGINLVAANRVVIFDVSWNPSHDTQSIFRVYRFGQDKPCYIYRLIAMGTMEQKVYERQVAKQATAKRVIDEQQISRHYNQSDLQELYTYELKPSTTRELPILPKDRLFAELLNEHEQLIFKYHEHDSLLENEEHENLTEAERKAAWAEYELEKTRTVQAGQYMSYDRNAFGANNTAANVTTNKIFGFRIDVLLQLLNMKVAKDRPELNANEITQLVPVYLQRLMAEMNGNDPTMYKELLTLHTTLAHPSGMYMSPLLYANQNPSAAGYYQAPMVGLPQQPGGSSNNNIMLPQTSAAAAVRTQPTTAALGFDPNSVYEID